MATSQPAAKFGVGGRQAEAAEAEQKIKNVEHWRCSISWTDGWNMAPGVSDLDWEIARRI
jgi:hypothetical protein